MSRTLVLFTLVLLIPVAESAPKVKEEKPDVYFPTAVGTKRVYALLKLDYVETITAVEPKDDRTVITVETSYAPGKAFTKVYSISPKGVFLEAEYGENLTTPQCILALPVTPNSTWEYEGPGPAEDRTKVKCRTVGEDTIEVPAGKFKAIQVDTTYTLSDGRAWTIARWYAPKVGLLREITKDRETGMLKSFTPALAKE